MYEWQLEDLYPSLESEAFQSDLQRAESLKTTFEELTLEDNIDSIREAITWYETCSDLFSKLFSYVSLRLSVDTTDVECTNYETRLSMIGANLSKELAKLEHYLGTVQTDIQQDDYLKQYSFLFHSLKEKATHILSEEVEEAIALMRRSAGEAWSNLQGYVTSSVEAEFDGEMKTLSEIRNLAYDANADVRRRAYEVELEMSSKIEDAVAFALNNIKSQVNDLTKLRGYDSALDATLKASRLSRATLDALIGAIQDNLPHFRRYLKHKGKLLGHENGLPFYDLFAPYGNSSRQMSVEEARTYLVEQFGTFSQDMADMTDEAFEKRYIDFYPRKGKRGGAFCHNLPFIKQSRIMMNYDGSMSNVLTLAHELGHAYHGLHVENHLPLNRDYTMPVAETASIFNETIVMNHLLSTSSDDEKIAMIESLLQDTTQIIVDIYSRYVFETAVFGQRQQAFLFPAQLKEMMLEAQKEAYGDGLDADKLHPYMWLNKPHYYSDGLSFYNFPYAFGGLFARGLYAMYQAQPDGFVSKYQHLLNQTTVLNVEDTARLVGVDVTDKSFWQTSLDGIVHLIDEFIRLTTQD